MIVLVLVVGPTLFAFSLRTGWCDRINFAGREHLETRGSHETVDEIPEGFANVAIVSNVAELFSDA